VEETLKLDSLDTVLIAGVNTRAIAKSAKSLGMKVIAVDRFDDLDLRENTDFLYSLERVEFENDFCSGEMDLFDLSSKALDRHDVDGIVITSGMEHYPEKVQKLENRVPVVGNGSDQLEFCEDKGRLFELAEELEIPHPETRRAESLDEALYAADELGYPVLLKRPSSGGGIGIKSVERPEELESLFDGALSSSTGNFLYIQDFVEGIDASASVISNGYEASCLAVTEQVIGEERLGVPRDFGYCGNVIPPDIEDDLISVISKFSEDICSEIGLLGSNGVDFVISDKPYLIEVNPRFQNTIDMLEGCMDLNLLKRHVESTEGKISDGRELERCSAKLIIYAEENIQAPYLSRFPDVVDVPLENSEIDKGAPVCSVLRFGEGRDEVVREAYRSVRKVQRSLYGYPT